MKEERKKRMLVIKSGLYKDGVHHLVNVFDKPYPGVTMHQQSILAGSAIYLMEAKYH